MESFLNKKNRKKNYFQIFTSQISPQIQKPKDKYMNNNNILLAIKDEEKSNEFENIPKIESDCLEKIDVKLKNLSDNENKILNLSLSNDKIENNILNKNDNNKGLNIDNKQIKLLEKSNDTCNASEGLEMDKIVQNTVIIKANKKRLLNDKTKNLFKKFKS